MIEPATRLRAAVSSLRTVGTVFLILGGLAAAIGALAGSRNAAMVEFLCSSSLLWVGPGVLYHVAAVLIRRHDVRMGTLARRTAIAQSALAILAIAVSFLTGAFARGGQWSPALMPAAVAAFFVPALLVQAYQIGKALEALRHLPPPGHGFEIQPMPVLPVDAAASSADAEHPI